MSHKEGENFQNETGNTSKKTGVNMNGDVKLKHNE